MALIIDIIVLSLIGFVLTLVFDGRQRSWGHRLGRRTARRSPAFVRRARAPAGLQLRLLRRALDADGRHAGHALAGAADRRRGGRPGHQLAPVADPLAHPGPALRCWRRWRCTCPTASASSWAPWAWRGCCCCCTPWPRARPSRVSTTATRTPSWSRSGAGRLSQLEQGSPPAVHNDRGSVDSPSQPSRPLRGQLALTRAGHGRHSRSCPEGPDTRPGALRSHQREPARSASLRSHQGGLAAREAEITSRRTGDVEVAPGTFVCFGAVYPWTTSSRSHPS